VQHCELTSWFLSWYKHSSEITTNNTLFIFRVQFERTRKRLSYVVLLFFSEFPHSVVGWNSKAIRKSETQSIRLSHWLSYRSEWQPSVQEPYKRRVLDDGLISYNINIKTNYLAERIRRTSGCECAELLIDPSFWDERNEYQWEQETRIFVEAISFFERSQSTCVHVRMRVNGCER